MMTLRCPVQLIRNCVSGIQSHALRVSNFIPGRFFAHQQSLPRLPVPPLQQTLDKYLKTVRPLVTEAEFKATETLVRDFGRSGGIGEELQKFLEDRYKEKENWLSDWWLDQAYLLSRASVVVNCSPSVSFPRYLYHGRDGQVKQAAKVISAILDYKGDIDNETLAIEKLGGKELCMDQYYRILSSCRIPGVQKDGVESFSKSWKPPRHITVIYKNRFYEMLVYGDDGTPLSINQLEETLRKIVENSSVDDELPVGALTGLDRDRWGKIYQVLGNNENNKVVLKSIQSSIFAICLDKSPAVTGSNWRSEFALNCLHGCGSHLNTGNRWFDKTIQMVVDESGGVGLIYEHAPAEGPPIASLLDHVYKYCESPPQDNNISGNQQDPVELKFEVNDEVKQMLDVATGFLDSLSSSVKLEVIDFKEFGKDFIKSQKLSPDSFIQIAFQLTYWRLHNQQPATYESGSLRQFRLGRTDTIRSCSIESQAFVESMDSMKLPLSDKCQLLREAISSHRKYTTDTVGGNGIDRHLLGFRLAAQEKGLPAPDILNDESYKRAMHFNLSTSQVPSKADLCMAFGPAVLDGYGLCYNPKNDKILVSISTFDTNPNYSPGVFSKELQNSFCDMKALLLSSLAKL